MNRHAILHIMDSAYCFPVSEKEMVIRLRTAKSDIIKAEVIYESKYVIGNIQRSKPMEKAFTDELFDYYVTRLVLKDTRLAYVFRIDDGNEEWYYSEDGVTKEYDFKLGYYNYFQYPYINPADVMKKVGWTETACFYQIFVDRFKIGNTNKDMSYTNCKWGDIPTPKTFAGGDIKGITEELDYIRGLGCNVIYLTPVFESISNHKYDISDYYKIDEQFGTEDNLKELVEEAHKRDMRIVLDAVFNHCSNRTEQFRDVVLYGKQSRYFNWFIIYGDNINTECDNYERFGPCYYMPKWNTSNKETADFLIGVGKYYIEKFGIDGWRLDVADEVSHSFWRDFRKAVKGCREDVLILGENWHDAYSSLRGDQYDGIMNYSFTKACLDYFAKDKFNAANMSDRLNEILMRNSDTVNSMMLNLLDSHDTNRFYTEVGEDDFKFEAALCLTYMFPGIPCIFYGTEIKMQGGFDPDCRRCMNWEVNDGTIPSLLKKLSDIRINYGISRGSTRIYSENDNLYTVIQTGTDKLVLRINLKQREYEIKSDGGKII